MHPIARPIARAESKLWGLRIIPNDSLRFVVLTFSKMGRFGEGKRKFLCIFEMKENRAHYIQNCPMERSEGVSKYCLKFVIE